MACVIRRRLSRYEIFADPFRFWLDTYLAAESCLETKGTFARGGKEEVRMFWHHIYTLAEIRRMLAAHGLETVETFGSLERAPFGLGAQSLTLVAQKR